MDRQQTDGQSGIRQTDKQAVGRQMDRQQTDRYTANRERDRQAVGRHMYRQTESQAVLRNRQSDSQTAMQLAKNNKEEGEEGACGRERQNAKFTIR